MSNEKETTKEKVLVSMSKWVAKEIIGEQINKSARIEELIIKGFMSEKIGGSQLQTEKIESKSAFYQLMANDLDLDRKNQLIS